MSDFQRGLQAFERLVKSDEGIRAGSCRKCGGSGHLTYECRNLIKLDGPTQKPKSSSRFGFLKKQLGSAGSASPSPSGTAVSSPGTGAADKTASGSGPGSIKKSEQSSKKKKRSSSKSSKSSEGSESPSESDSDDSEDERAATTPLEIVQETRARGVVERVQGEMIVGPDPGLHHVRLRLRTLDPDQGSAVVDTTKDLSMMKGLDPAHQLLPGTAVLMLDLVRLTPQESILEVDLVRL
ncbi:hypothetical protein BGZ58_004412 [Dissophora ornata]|nr:hypothetical protein BGZ58_004412 [Dissophora ornata]